MMGIATFDFVHDNSEVHGIFEGIDLTFLIIFTFELIIQLIVNGMKWHTDSWLVFDFIIVVSSWAFSGVKVIRSFRIFRAFRLFGRVGSLKRIVEATSLIVNDLAAILLVIFVFSYISAVLMTNLFRDLYDEGYYSMTDINYFGRLDYTFFTLIIFLTLDDWSEPVRLSNEKYWWAWFPMLGFMFIAALIVLNLVTAILCDAVTNLRQGEGMELGADDAWDLLDDDAPPAWDQDELNRYVGKVARIGVLRLAISEALDESPDMRQKTESLHELLTTASSAAPKFMNEDTDESSPVTTGVPVEELDCSLSEASTSTSRYETLIINENASNGNVAIDGGGNQSHGKTTRLENFRHAVTILITDDRFQTYMTCLIIVNSLMMGLSTFDWVKDDPRILKVFETVDTVFLLVFTIELAANLFAYRREFFNDPWLNFDFIVILSSWIFSSIKIIRTCRIIRAFRLFGRVKSLKRTAEAIVSTGPEIQAIFMVLALLFYIFAVMFTQLFIELSEESFLDDNANEDGFNYFGSLPKSLLTCMMLTTFDHVDKITRGVTSAIWWGWIPIVVFITLISYIVLNLIIAAFCESLQLVRKREESNECDDAEDRLKEGPAAVDMHSILEDLRWSQDILTILFEVQALVHMDHDKILRRILEKKSQDCCDAETSLDAGSRLTQGRADKGLDEEGIPENINHAVG